MGQPQGPSQPRMRGLTMANDDFWSVVEPERWPDPPDEFSFSSLHEIEQCPRSWSYRHAVYSSPSMSGYPTRPSPAALEGMIVHNTLERLAHEFRQAGCTTTAEAVEVVRSLGGLDVVVRDESARALARIAGNPRVSGQVDTIEAEINRRLPSMRQYVQGAARMLVGEQGAHGRDGRSPGRTTRGPLAHGYHAEVFIAPRGLPFVGRADAIYLDPSDCTIIDFKTGRPKPEHHEQLETYALLWARDDVLNPDGRLASRLVNTYGNTERTFEAPDVSRLGEIEAGLTRRLRAAAAEFAAVPPRANVGPDACRHCDVKQLCDPFWQADAPVDVAIAGLADYRSLQVSLDRRLSDMSWSGTVEHDSLLKKGTVVIATQNASGPLRNDLGRFRLVDVRVLHDEEENVLIQLGKRSEVFALRESTLSRREGEPLRSGVPQS